MQFSIINVDGSFDLRDSNCLLAAILTSLAMGTLAFMMARRLLAAGNRRPAKRKVIMILVIIGALALMSSPITRVLASIFATMDMHASGTYGSFGYFGFAPLWPSAITCSLGVVIAITMARKKGNGVVT